MLESEASFPVVPWNVADLTPPIHFPDPMSPGIPYNSHGGKFVLYALGLRRRRRRVDFALDTRGTFATEDKLKKEVLGSQCRARNGAQGSIEAAQVVC